MLNSSLNFNKSPPTHAYKHYTSKKDFNVSTLWEKTQNLSKVNYINNRKIVIENFFDLLLLVIFECDEKVTK